MRFEMSAAGATSLSALAGAVVGRGGSDVVAALNVTSRCASRVLVELARLEAPTEEALLDGLRGLPFETWIPRGATFAAEAHLREAAVTHSLHAARRVKDGVMDRLRDRKRERPVVDPKRPTYRFVLHWEYDRATLALDTTGAPLHRRGYRAEGGEAPMRETLAAAILALGYADTRRPFRDPCCGTGTLAIEQALRSLKRAPGARRRFAIDHWPDDRLALRAPLDAARARARDEERPKLEAPIALSDWHPDAVRAAEQSVASAGLGGLLVVERKDARRADYEDGMVVCSNLPFGERLGKARLQLEGFYRTLGARLGQIPDARILLFTATQDAERLLGLGQPIRRWSLYSGQMKAMLRRWDLTSPDEEDLRERPHEDPERR